MLRQLKIMVCILSFILLSLGILISCDEETSPGDESFTVTFTYTNIDSHDGAGAHDGQTLYAKLATSDCMGTAVVWGSAIIADDTAVIVATNVPEGTYIGCGFIDVNGNAAGDGTSLPDSGDITGDSGGVNISITGTQSFTVDTSGWISL